jgi:hypothetical protein
MQLQTARFQFTLLTPCFGGTALGKLDDHAEMRIPPIRGHVRFWHRALFSADDCNRVWGNAAGTSGHASRVALRFAGQVSDKQALPKPSLLPHKGKTSGSPRAALASGETFVLQLQRLINCSNTDWDHAQRAVKAWLLLGCVGLRSNRAAGSVWPEDSWVPDTPETLKATLEELGLRGWSVAVVGLGSSSTPARLRETASDTLSGFTNVPIFGGIKPREPSPTKFKVARMRKDHAQESEHCLIALAPSRPAFLNNHSQPILQHAEQLLRDKGDPVRWKELGQWQHLLP